ncbi:MAG: prephenate dehydratase [Solirubrobacterales bacterium]|nr:prephenate dehydratase [Solirubrobacterales bacterium]
MRAAYLGPAGTNSHEALVAAGLAAENVSFPTVGAVVAAVQEGAAEFALVPIENSREGAVAATLDALVFDAPDVRIVGELVHRVSYCLAAADAIAPDEVRTVHSHPQATGQCARFLAEQLPGAAVIAAASTAEAMRAVAGGEALAGFTPHAAIGTQHAAALYGAAVLAERIEDDAENATRFAWVAHAGSLGGGGDRADHGGLPATTDHPAAPTAPIKTALVFWGGGDHAPGWLVDCLTEFSSRAISLTRIESRPRRVGLGSYMFFCDLEGAAESAEIGAAIAGLRARCDSVRVLGSFPAAA